MPAELSGYRKDARYRLGLECNSPALLQAGPWWRFMTGIRACQKACDEDPRCAAFAFYEDFGCKTWAECSQTVSAPLFILDGIPTHLYHKINHRHSDDQRAAGGVNYGNDPASVLQRRPSILEREGAATSHNTVNQCNGDQECVDNVLGKHASVMLEWSWHVFFGEAFDAEFPNGDRVCPRPDTWVPECGYRCGDAPTCSQGT